MQPLRRRNRRRKPTPWNTIKTKEQRRVSKMNVTEEDRYTWTTSEGIHQLRRTWSTGPLPGVKHTDNVHHLLSLIQEVLQWREAPGSSTWTTMGSTNTWGSILMGKTTGCSPTTDRSCETWEDIREGSTKPSTNTMIDIHMVGSHAPQNKVGFQLTVPAKLHHLSFIFDLYLVNPKLQDCTYYLTLFHCKALAN